MFDGKWLCGRRFAVRQGADGEKIRLIDGFSVCKVNSAISSDEKIALQHVDSYIAVARYWSRSSRSPLNLEGKCVDLESAYWQLAIDPQHQRFAVIAIWNHCTKGVQLYLIKALPFGAVSSVYGFLRASSAIQVILCRLFAVPMTIYFDGLSLIATDSDAEHIDYIVTSVLQLLGWKTSSNPKKQHQFGKVFSMLGVNIDMFSTLDGYIKISNKPSRVQDFCRAIERFLRDGEMTSQEAAASLKEKMSYMDAQHFARLGIPTTKSLDRRARAHSTSTKFGDELRESLRWALFLLHHGPPRVVRLSCSQDQVVIFTDGAVEGVDHRECSMGAVAFFPHRGPEYFSATIPMKIVDFGRANVENT